MDVREEDFTVLADQKEHSPSISVSGISGRASLEIDLRGRRLDEALEDVSRQIDQALLSGVNRFGIIHGTGEGVLQKGVRDYLSRHPNVASYEFARPEDGGFGKTHVNIG